MMNIGALNNSNRNNVSAASGVAGDMLQQSIGLNGRATGPPIPGLVAPLNTDSQQQQQQRVLLDQLNNHNAAAPNHNTLASNSVVAMPLPLANDTINIISANANNPDYHPHLNDRNLLNNPFWKLQLTLSNISLNTLLSGQSNIYARQIALQKKNGRDNLIDMKTDHLNNNNNTNTNISNSNSNDNNSNNNDNNNMNLGDLSDVTLVDKTKQLLMDIAIEKESTINTTTNNNNTNSGNTTTATTTNVNDSGIVVDTATTTTNNSAVSTPLNTSVDLNNTNIPLQLTLLQNKKLSQFNIDDEDDEIEFLLNKEMEKDNNNNRSPNMGNNDNENVNGITSTTVAKTTTNDIMSKFKYNDQLWYSLDLSNLQLLNLSNSLFNYTFLTRLYLNGNGLIYLPKEIKKLNNLRVLDLSNNKIANIPSELGFCFKLKYLYLFNNQINQLPWELGNLYNLQFLGIEGNPLDPKLLKILTEKSMTGLIFYLRDNRPEIPLLNARKFIEISKDGEPIHESNSLDESEQFWKSSNKDPDLAKKSFTVLQYNTLCQHYATPKMYRYTPSWALAWEYRKNKLKDQILSYNCDIICLQEVEAKTYEEYWSPLLQKTGYTGLFHAKTRAKLLANKDSKKVDGCCVFFKNNKFKMLKFEHVDFSATWMKHSKFQRTEDFLNRAMNKDNVALITKLQHLQTGEPVWCVTTHLHWDPKFNDVKTFQVGVLLDHLQSLIKEDNPRQDIKKVPIILCGDFNSYVNSAVYELLSTGSVKNHPDGITKDYGYMSQSNFNHQLALSSSYGCIGELPFTNFTPSFVDVIDYIWYSSNALRVRGLLGKVDEQYVSKFIGFPNEEFPSDHLPLITKFEFLKNSISTRAHSNISGSNNTSGSFTGSTNNSNKKNNYNYNSHSLNNSNINNSASIGSRKV